MSTQYLKDGNGNISIIYAVSNDGSYKQLYGKSGEHYEYKVDNNKIPFIGYKKDNNLVFYNAIGEVFIFENDSINNDINIT